MVIYNNICIKWAAIVAFRAKNPLACFPFHFIGRHLIGDLVVFIYRLQCRYFIHILKKITNSHTRFKIRNITTIIYGMYHIIIIECTYTIRYSNVGILYTYVIIIKNLYHDLKNVLKFTLFQCVQYFMLTSSWNELLQVYKWPMRVT